MDEQVYYYLLINSYYYGNVLLLQIICYYLNYVFFGGYVVIYFIKCINFMICNIFLDYEIQFGSQDLLFFFYLQVKLVYMNFNEICIQ